jgi:hypothetical protein
MPGIAGRSTRSMNCCAGSIVTDGSGGALRMSTISCGGRRYGAWAGAEATAVNIARNVAARDPAGAIRRHVAIER